MHKLFLYDPASVTNDTLAIMKEMGYTCIALTNDPTFFWETIAKMSNGGILVLLSHGDKNGPLAVKGEYGDDINLDDFVALMITKSLNLYLLSCYTGLSPCGTKLQNQGFAFVAPKGIARFETVGEELVTVKSKGKNGDYPGWTGPLQPSGRSSKPLYLP